MLNENSNFFDIKAYFALRLRHNLLGKYLVMLVRKSKKIVLSVGVSVCGSLMNLERSSS